MIDFRHGLAQDVLSSLPPQSVDVIVTDPSYGSLPQRAWDHAPDLGEMWDLFYHVLRPDGTIVLTAQQPFSSEIVCSNKKFFRSEWIWRKSQVGGRMNAKGGPLSVHEHVLVFARGRVTPNARDKIRYFPQGTVPCLRSASRGDGPFNKSASRHYTQRVTNYPVSVVHYANDRGPQSFHDSQKPLGLMKMLVETYSLPGETVCDPYAGSATVAVAALETGRHFVGCECNQHYFDLALLRLERAKLHCGPLPEAFSATRPCLRQQS